MEPPVRRSLRPPAAESREKSFATKTSSSLPAAKKQIPPEQTNAENFYYIKQMSSKTPMVVVLKDGEVLRGIIEWYDRASIKLNREGAPNLLVFKAAVKYMYKAEDEV